MYINIYICIHIIHPVEDLAGHLIVAPVVAPVVVQCTRD